MYVLFFFFKLLYATYHGVRGLFLDHIYTYSITHTVGGPLLTCSQQSAGASSEGNTEQNMDKGHWSTKTPNLYIFFFIGTTTFASIMDLLQASDLRSHYWFPNSFIRGGVVNPLPNPQLGGPCPIFITPGTVWPSYTHRHWVSILVAFYDMHGLQWDYSLNLVTTRDQLN